VTTHPVPLLVTMKASLFVVLSVSAVALAGPKFQRRAACTSNVTLSGNPFASRKQHANIYYRKEVEAAAAAISDSSLKASALKVADVGTFLWM
jgi:hypothetical protein